VVVVVVVVVDDDVVVVSGGGVVAVDDERLSPPHAVANTPLRAIVIARHRMRMLARRYHTAIPSHLRGVCAPSIGDVGRPTSRSLLSRRELATG
jgi:hypothetical protein